jgi:hypothetical protein
VMFPAQLVIVSDMSVVPPGSVYALTFSFVEAYRR